MRLLLQFAAANGKKKVTQLGLDDLDAGLVSQYRLGQAQKVAAIPRKRAQPPETIFLERDEIEGTLARLPIELTYKDPGGKPSVVLLYRDREPTLEIAETGRPWSFDGDGKLVKNAHDVSGRSLPTRQSRGPSARMDQHRELTATTDG